VSLPSSPSPSPFPTKPEAFVLCGALALPLLSFFFLAPEQVFDKPEKSEIRRELATLKSLEASSVCPACKKKSDPFSRTRIQGPSGNRKQLAKKISWEMKQR